MLSRTLYLDPPASDRALWLSCGYVDTGLTREEITTTSGESDAYYDWQRRTSPDNGYGGQRLVFAPDGTVYFPIIAATAEDPAKAGVVLMRRDPRTGRWTASNLVRIDPKLSWRGLLEPDLAILNDGRLLIVCRAARGETTPCRKWFTCSTDGGRTLSDVAEFRYDDGSSFFSPGSIHQFCRSSTDGRLYWVANIVPQPIEDGPRYPLFLAEIDETRMAVKRDSLVMVDDRRIGEGDTEKLQLSNFSLLENRETFDLEIYITRIGQSDRFWHAGVYKYTFHPRP